MKNLYKAALLAALGLGSITGAQASSDLIFGFNDNNASQSGAHNDYVIDLSLDGAGLVAAANLNGGTYNFSSLFNATTFNNAFGADGNALNQVAAGIVGGYSISNPKLIYQTVAIGVTPAELSFGGAVNTAAGAAQGIQISPDLYSSANANGWTSLVSYDASIFGTIPSGGSVSGATGTSAAGQFNSGVLSMELWENQRNTSTGPAIGWVDQGTFNFNLNTGTFTFVTAVPEPSTYGLVTVAGLLALSFRRYFTRKNA